MSAQPKLNSRGKEIEELDDFQPVSIPRKRKFNDAFYEQTFDDSRYGQHIDSDFFKTNIGHSVVEEQSLEQEIRRKEYVKIVSNKEEQDILQWCQSYLETKNK